MNTVNSRPAVGKKLHRSLLKALQAELDQNNDLAEVSRNNRQRMFSLLPDCSHTMNAALQESWARHS